MDKQSQALPTAFVEEKHFSLDLYQKIQGEWWHMSEASTVAGAFRTIKYLPDEALVHMVATYKKQRIGEGEYYKRGPAGRLERIETIKTNAAIVDVIERAFRDYQEDVPSLEEELAQVYECDWPGCTRRVNGTAVVRTLHLQLDHVSQECTFYGCEQHSDALKRSRMLSVSLVVGTASHPRRSQSKCLPIR